MNFIIKNKYGEFVNINETNHNKLDFFRDTGDIEVAQQYTIPQIKSIKNKFQNDWFEYDFQIFELNISIKPINITELLE